jgi:hypothetical protein
MQCLPMAPKLPILQNGNLGMSRLEQLLEMIQHVLVCKEGDGLPFSEMAQMRPLTMSALPPLSEYKRT